MSMALPPAETLTTPLAGPEPLKHHHGILTILIAGFFMLVTPDSMSNLVQ